MPHSRKSSKQPARERIMAERVEESIEEAAFEVGHRRWENAIPILHHAVEQAMILNTRVRNLPIRRLGGGVKRPELSDSTIQAFDVLGVFYEAEPGELLGIADLADELGMSRSTVHRYVSTLCYLGQLEQHPPSRKYRRPTLHVLAGAGEHREPAEVRELARAA